MKAQELDVALDLLASATEMLVALEQRADAAEDALQEAFACPGCRAPVGPSERCWTDSKNGLWHWRCFEKGHAVRVTDAP